LVADQVVEDDDAGGGAISAHGQGFLLHHIRPIVEFSYPASNATMSARCWSSSMLGFDRDQFATNAFWR
jgi:hypothetical protein